MKKLGSERMFSSNCRILDSKVDISLKDCFLLTCYMLGNTINFRDNVCYVRQCHGNELQLEGDDSGWDIYVYVTYGR